MKRITLTTLLLLIVMNTILAQQETVQFGVKGGVNCSTLLDEYGTNDYRTGYHAGLFANIPLKDKFTLQPEVVYSAQGAKFANGKKHYLDYISVPLLGQYTVKNRFRIQTGLQLSYLTKSEVKYENAVEASTEHEGDLFNKVEKMDIAWTVGAGYVMPIGLGIDARYNLSPADISKFGYLENRVWQVGVFYQFH